MELWLYELREGQEGLLLHPPVEGYLGKRLGQFGMIHGTKLRCLRRNPGKGPLVLRVRGTDLVLRQELCRKLQVWVE